MINKNKNHGFTLMEMMITVAILGILSAITVPSYVKYVQKSKRTEAKTEILRIAQLQESYYVQNLSYALALNGTGGLGFSGSSLTTESGLYSVQVTGFDGDADNSTTCSGTSASPCIGYRIEATPVSGKGQDNDTDCAGGFRLTNTGAKRAKNSTDSDWSNAATRATCWN